MKLEDIAKRLQNIPEYVIEIGVMSSNKKRVKVQAGINLTNAEIMFINEYGAPLRKIPARPVLQMTIDWANANLLQDSLNKAIDRYVQFNFDDKQIDIELTKMCIKMENYARELIYSNDGRLVKNAPSTVKRKGFNHPLFQTGQLAKSITCRLRRVKGGT